MDSIQVVSLVFAVFFFLITLPLFTFLDQQIFILVPTPNMSIYTICTQGKMERSGSPLAPGIEPQLPHA